MRKETMAYVVVFTFLTTFVMAVMLSGAHRLTVARVERNEMERRRAVVLAAMGIPAESTEEVFNHYASLERHEAGEAVLYRYSGEEGDVVARPFRGPGVWGEIVGVVSVRDDGTRVVGVEILDHNETPGLGGRVTDETFLRQLRGERIGPDGITVVVRGPGDPDPENARIDGITGATGTTRAFDRMLNRELRALRALLRVDGSGVTGGDTRG